MAQVFVPRIIRKDEHTLRTYFCSQPAKEQAVTWYRDFDLRTQTFEDSIHKAKLKTAAGDFDMEPRHFHADAAAQGFTKPPVNQGLYIFDSFKEFDGRRYVALNNFPGKQNALAVLHDDLTTFEVIGHYNEPQSQQLSESAVNRLPDGTWMAICRNDAGNYHFTTSQDGKTWTVGEPKPFVPNGLNSKPTFDKFGGVYYLGWQENTRVHGCNRSVFNVDISRDGKTWERKYRFETPHSFQYPTFHEHEGTIWLTVTQSDHNGSSRPHHVRQAGRRGPVRAASGPETHRLACTAAGGACGDETRREALHRPRVRDRRNARAGARSAVPSHQHREDRSGSHQGRHALRAHADDPPQGREPGGSAATSGFTKVDVPEVQLFPGEINRVSLYRKDVKSGERLQFKKMVLSWSLRGAAAGVSAQSRMRDRCRRSSSRTRARSFRTTRGPAR